jgi:hypothetical protein
MKWLMCNTTSTMLILSWTFFLINNYDWLDRFGNPFIDFMLIFGIGVFAILTISKWIWK